MSFDNNAIVVDKVSKCFEIYSQPSDRLKQFFAPKILKGFGGECRKYFEEFWALNDISFSVKKGETVGIIGKNGSGKSTLLQIICGTLMATTGSVTTNGRIAALLELGSGFNPDFTGRENVYLNGSVLGLTKSEIDARYDDIAAFADIGKFIDQPVKTYSSGMVVRLAFAVQSQIDPEILIVDEALSVGDAKFQAKCFERLKRLKEHGTSILLVTHSSEQIVTHCDRAVLINEGRLVEVGEPRNVVNQYLDILFGRSKAAVVHDQIESGEKVGISPAASDVSELSVTKDIFHTRIGYNHLEYRWGDGNATILDYELAAEDRKYPTQVETGEKLRIRIAIGFKLEISNPVLGLTVKTKEGVTVYGANSESLDFTDFKSIGKKGGTCCVEMLFTCRLAAGDYFISIGIASRDINDVIPHDRRYDSIHIHVIPNQSFHGLVDLGLTAKLL